MKLQLVITDITLEQIYLLAGALDEAAAMEVTATASHPKTSAQQGNATAAQTKPSTQPSNSEAPPGNTTASTGTSQPSGNGNQQPASQRVASERSLRFMLDQFAKNGYDKGDAILFIEESYPDVPILDKNGDWILPQPIVSQMIDNLKAGHVAPGPAAPQEADFNDV